MSASGVVPSLRRVLVTYCRSTATRLGVTVLERSMTEPLQVGGGHDGILIVRSGTDLNIPGRSLEVATSNNIPTMYPAQAARLTHKLAHKILTGTPPWKIPAQLPDRIPPSGPRVIRVTGTAPSPRRSSMASVISAA